MLSNAIRPDLRPAPVGEPQTRTQRAWWWPKALLDDGELSLTAMLDGHAAAFLDAFRSDIEMARFTGMPEFTSQAEVRDWLRAQQQKPGAVDFALMHQVHGFIGCVGAECVGRTAVFYFWIHRGVYGQGIGQRAARLLFMHLGRLDFQMVAAFAWRFNQRSIRSLRKLGMVESALPAGHGDDRLLYFCQPLGD